MTPPTCRIAIWNAEFRKPTSARGSAIRAILTARNADVICLTEGYPGNLPRDGHVVCSGADHGYGTTDGRRKVLLWSRESWTDVDDVGDPDLPSGRFIRAVTRTPIGEMTVVGVCIPWEWAHVRTGRKDRQRWEDHLAYLAGLGRVLRRCGSTRVIVAGDWNQTVPRTRAPQRGYEALQHTFSDMTIATAGPLPPLQRPAIDHLAHSQYLVSEGVESWSAIDRARSRADGPLRIRARRMTATVMSHPLFPARHGDQRSATNRAAVAVQAALTCWLDHPALHVREW